MVPAVPGEVDAKATTGGGRGVFGPELEASFDAEGGEKVRVDGWGKPLELWDKS